MDDDIDTGKIDRAVLALLYLTLHDEYRAWKGHDWAALDRLHEKGFISNPASKAKSVVFTEEGLAESRAVVPRDVRQVCRLEQQGRGKPCWRPRSRAACRSRTGWPNRTACGRRGGNRARRWPTPSATPRCCG